MSIHSFDRDLENRAELFKALGHPVRLLILNLIRLQPRHVEELGLILNLTPATISHHLAKLTEAGLLTSRKDQYYQVYTLITEQLDWKLYDLVCLPQPGLAREVKEDAFREKVLRTFFRRGRLIGIPRQLKKQQAIFEKLAEEFEPGRSYSEPQVNHILIEYHEDVASLRRGLIEHGYLQRQRGIYRRVESPPKT
jgi:ArsR family transcriptional regulator